MHDILDSMREAVYTTSRKVSVRSVFNGEIEMRFVMDDGGRAAAGFKGKAGDCVARSISIATGVPYAEVYASLNELATRERTGKRKRGVSSARNGVYRTTYQLYLEGLGWVWTPTMKIGQGCKVHLRSDELPAGRLIVSLSKHMTAVVHGTIHDTYDPSRGGTRCVYGYYSHPNPINERTPHAHPSARP